MFMLQDGGIGCADLLLGDGGRVIVSHLHRCGIRGYFDFRNGLFMPVPMVRKDGFLNESCCDENAKGIIQDFTRCVKNELTKKGDRTDLLFHVKD